MTLARSTSRSRTHLAPAALLVHLAIGGWLLIGAADPVLAQSTAANVQADVPAGPLAEALNRFALQAGVSIAVDAAKVRGLRSLGLKGSVGVDEGFRRLLVGSGFQVGKTAAGYVLVAASPVAPTAARPVAPAGAEATLPAVQVTASADASRQDIPKPYAGGQVARGARVGLLGNKDYMETPFSITSYTDEAVKGMEARTRLQVLELDPSVIRATGAIEAQDQFLVRGFTVYGYQATVDGLNGMVGTTGRDTEMYERIELTKGPSAMLNGAASAFNVGGSVNLVTKYALDAPLARLNTRWSEKSELTNHLDIGRRFGQDKQFGLRANLVYGDGARNTVDAGAVPDFRRKLASLALDYRGERLRLKLHTYRLDDDQTVSGTVNGLSLDLQDPTQPARRPLIGLGDTALYREQRATIGRVEADLATNTTASLTYGHSKGLTVQRFVTVTALDAATGNATLQNGLYGEWSSTYQADAGLTTAFETGPVSHQVAVNLTRAWNKIPAGDGYVFLDGEPFSSNLLNQVPGPLLPQSLVKAEYSGKINPEYTRAIADTLGFWDDRLQLTLGVRRLDSIPDTTPSVSALFKATPQVSVYGNYIEGVQAKQKAPLNTSPNPADQIVNPGEEFPATATKQREIGAKLDLGEVGATAALFQIEQISYFTNRATRRFGAEGLQTNRGLELSVFGKPWSGLVVSGGYAYIDAKLSRTEDPAVEGHTAPGVPKHTFTLWGAWAVPSVPGLSLLLRSRTQSPQFASSSNLQRAPGYTVISGGATYATRIGVPLVLRATVENLTDKPYYVSFGRDRVEEGTPRTVTVSAQLDF